jgi:hypothetical protein
MIQWRQAQTESPPEYSIVVPFYENPTRIMLNQIEYVQNSLALEIVCWINFLASFYP